MLMRCVVDGGDDMCGRMCVRVVMRCMCDGIVSEMCGGMRCGRCVGICVWGDEDEMW